MPVHLLAHCPGAATPEVLRARIAALVARDPAGPGPGLVTRRAPGRRGEVLDGGSLYWVMEGRILARQAILGLGPVPAGARRDGRIRHRVTLDPAVVEVAPRKRRPFHGWRYLEEGEAPPDLAPPPAGIPSGLAAELAALGLA